MDTVILVGQFPLALCCGGVLVFAGCLWWFRGSGVLGCLLVEQLPSRAGFRHTPGQFRQRHFSLGLKPREN